MLQPERNLLLVIFRPAPDEKGRRRMTGKASLLMIPGGAVVVFAAFFATMGLLNRFWPATGQSGATASQPAIQTSATASQSTSPTSAGSGITVRSATYGGNCKAKAGNATASIQSACSGKSACDYMVDVSKLGDPAQGCGKAFTVEYACGAQTATKTADLPGEADKKLAHLSCP
jgi:hypothetical protein